jgi:DNA-binding response OmpR family regulator
MARLLCVGDDPELLKLRCEVLCRAGYDALFTTVVEAEAILNAERFDLVIISAWLKERENEAVAMAAGKTPALLLDRLTLVDDLLLQVESLLSQPRAIQARLRT